MNTRPEAIDKPGPSKAAADVVDTGGKAHRPAPGTKTEILQRAAISLSIANLCFLFIWGHILALATEGKFSYFLQRAPEQSLIWALTFDIAVLAAAVYGLLSLSRNRARLLAFSSRVTVGFFCLLALWQCQVNVSAKLSSTIGFRFVLTLWTFEAAGILLLCIRWRRPALRAIRALFLICSPLFFVLLAQGLWFYCGPNSRRFDAGRAAGPLTSDSPHNRVIWIIFDELDGKLLFDACPDRIRLPHFDRLRRSSLYADHVKSPSHNTLSSIPSLLLSRDIPRDEDIDLNSRSVRVRFSGCSQFADIQSQENVFLRARRMGFNTAVTGWYHPYCRLFGQDLSSCASEQGLFDGAGIHEFLRPKPLWAKAAYLADWQSRTFTLVALHSAIQWAPDQSLLNRQLHIERLGALMRDGSRMLRDRKLNFVFLHLSVPHPPGIWDTQTQSFGTESKLDYIGNLKLADIVLGKIRALLQSTGDWDRSTVLISSDHPYRPVHWLVELNRPAPREMVRLTRTKWQPYIPFFLKMPGQKTGIEYHHEFNSVLSGNLLLAALQGQIRTPSEAVQWIDAHAATSEQNVCRAVTGTDLDRENQPN